MTQRTAGFGTRDISPSQTSFHHATYFHRFNCNYQSFQTHTLLMSFPLFLPRCPSLPVAHRQNQSHCSHITNPRTLLRAITLSHSMSTAHNTTAVHRRKKGVLIITGYVCIGKTYFCNNVNTQSHPKFGKIVDLDSSLYSRDRFPENYLEDIRRTADKHADEGCVILVSTFPGVGPRLKQEGFYVAQIYPHSSPTNKSEWLRRLELREKEGKQSRLYQLVNQHWYEWSDEMDRRDVSKSIRVSSNEYLSNVIDEIYADFENSR